MRRGGQTAGDGQRAARIVDGIVGETGALRGSGGDGIGAGPGSIGRAGTGEGDVRNGIAVQQPAAGEFRAGEDQGLAVELVRAIRGDG